MLNESRLKVKASKPQEDRTIQFIQKYEDKNREGGNDPKEN